ncbi:unnamed protein product [Rotaria magnacalcarata]
MASDNYDQTFECMVCLESPTESLMCRFCSKFICVSCVNRIFENSENDKKCPHCRVPVHRDDFTRVCWLQDHLKWVDDQMKLATTNKCPEHERVEISIFCLTCSVPICAHCLLSIFHGKHVQHDCCSLKDANNRIVSEVQSHIDRARQALDKGQNDLRKTQKSIDGIHQRKAQLLAKLSDMVTAIQVKIDEEIDEQLQKFEDKRKIFIGQINQHNEMITIAENEIKSKSKSELIDVKKELLSKFTALPSFSICNDSIITENILANFLVLPWQTAEFVFYNFTKRNSSSGKSVLQKYNLDYDQTWSLIIYPNNFNYKHQHVLSIFLKLDSGIPQPIEYTFIIELLHSSGDASRKYSMERTHSFQPGLRSGWESFYQVNCLKSDGFIWQNEDQIKFRFKIRTATILEQIKLLESHAHQMKDNARDADDVAARLQGEKKKIELKVTEQRKQIEQMKRKESELKESLANKKKDNEFIADERSQLKALKRDNECLTKKLNNFVEAKKRHHPEDLRNGVKQQKKSRHY